MQTQSEANPIFLLVFVLLAPEYVYFVRDPRQIKAKTGAKTVLVLCQLTSFMCLINSF